MANKEITYEGLKGLIIYDNGKLIWNPQSKWSGFWNLSKRIAGGSDKTTGIRIRGNNYLKTHVIFFLHYQRWPVSIKHKDGNKLNRRIENLEESNIGPKKYCQK